MNEFAQSDILLLSGPSRQRGRIHGESLRTKIKELMNHYKDYLALTTGGLLDQYIHDLVSKTGFINAIQRWTPSLLEEVKGISEGADIKFNDIFAFQLQDEEWWFGQERKQGLLEPARNCSSIGWQGPITMVAQNMDMPDYLDGYQVILRITDPQSEVEALVFSTAGLIALNGVNNHSIGIVCNNLGQLNHSRNGLPVAFVHRGVLDKKSFSEAKSFLETIHHASGQNYMLGGNGLVVDLECSAHQVAAYGRSENSESLCHTNHPFLNTDFWGVAPDAKLAGDDLKAFFDSRDINSRTRFETISKQLGELEAGQLGLKAAKKLLQSHDSSDYPVCRHSRPGIPWMTLGTTIMELTPDPRLHVCPGPPCSSTFTSLGFQ